MCPRKRRSPAPEYQARSSAATLSASGCTSLAAGANKRQAPSRARKLQRWQRLGAELCGQARTGKGRERWSRRPPCSCALPAMHCTAGMSLAAAARGHTASSPFEGGLRLAHRCIVLHMTQPAAGAVLLAGLPRRLGCVWKDEGPLRRPGRVAYVKPRPRLAAYCQDDGAGMQLRGSELRPPRLLLFLHHHQRRRRRQPWSEEATAAGCGWTMEADAGSSLAGGRACSYACPEGTWHAEW